MTSSLRHSLRFKAALVCLACSTAARANDPVLQAQDQLIETIDRLSRTAVCIYDAAQRGGGSGVLIDAEGYGLTNYHVVAGMIEKRTGWGGLNDGNLYELRVLGIDPVGDLAMFQLKSPPGAKHAFPFARLGDSDRVRMGDTVIAAGNPFILSEDYTPSISVGLVSGTHRYQWGVGGNLIYSDCIQTDAAINPGNSGGPLFNTDGEIIGINGRISVGARGRLNVGHGYAISSNQVRRFIPALRAGLLARHGTMGASVIEAEPGRVFFADLKADGAAGRAGVRNGDRLSRFDGIPILSQNTFASLLGTYPEDWPLPLEVETDGKSREVVVRLDPVQPKMRAPFTPEKEVNLAAVRRLLNGYRRAVYRDASAAVPLALTWNAAREFAPDDQGRVRFAEKYDVMSAASEPVRMQRRYDDGNRGFQIVYDDSKAVKYLTQDGDQMDLPTGERIVLHALFVLQRHLSSEVSEEQLANVSHGGADYVTPRPNQAAPISRASQPWEVVDWPIGEHTHARFSFEPGTGRVVRIRVRDIATNEQATIELSDYNWAAGLMLPHTLDVRAGTTAYRETLSNWNAK